MVPDASPLIDALATLPAETEGFRTPSVDRHFFHATATAMRAIGFDVSDACARHGLPDPLAISDERIPLTLVSPMYDLAARELDDPAFVYRLVDHVSSEGTALLFRLVICCATPLEMLHMSCRYSSIASDVVRYEFSDHGTHAVLRVVPNPAVYVSVHQLEMAVLLFARWRDLVRGMTGLAADCEIALAHAPRFEVRRYEEYFGGMPVRFNNGITEVTHRGGMLYQTVPGHDERQLDYFRSLAERYERETLACGDLVAQVATLFMQRMAFGEPDAATIAALLGMSRRTLQRRLLEAGSSWREATDLARRRVAESELENPARPLHEIALLTGYADTRAFLRGFRRWTGLTPSQFRLQRTNHPSRSMPHSGD